jgi:peptidoglycan/LPS O-acetylase OafA/YrhL
MKKLFVDPINISRINFRNDINILRALAVLAVVMYHYELGNFNGGWLGVDVFFLISGYLIGNIIISELNTKKFSFKNFYLRRVKRLLPTLFLTNLLTLILGFVFFDYVQIVELSRSIIASIFFYGNYFFAGLDFYTAGGSEKVPLLNTWSLAVEEQFYLLFPLSIYLLSRSKKNIFITSIILISVFSVLLNQTDDVLKFYYLPHRAWEFLIGVILNFLRRINIHQIYSYIGYLILFFSFYYFDESLVVQLEPKIVCLFGVILILFTENKDNYIFRVLDNKVVHNIGLTSYTIYLLHHPIYSLVLIYLESNLENINITYKLFSLCFVFILSNIVFKIFEEKFILNFDKIKKVILTILFLTIVVTCYVIITTDTFINIKYRGIDQKVIEYSEVYNYELKQDDQLCDSREVSEICVFNENNKEKMYFIGDSQMKTIAYDFTNDVRFGRFQKSIFTRNGCIPVIGNNSCTVESPAFIENINDSIVIFGGRVPLYIQEGSFFNGSYTQISYDFRRRQASELVNTINLLLQNNNKVIFIYSIPNQAWDVNKQIMNGYFKWGEVIGYEKQYWIERLAPAVEILNEIKSERFYPVDSYKLFCEDIIKDICVASDGESLLYGDFIHLSIEGTTLIKNEIIKKTDILK